ncbi:DUF4381 domain-containing protein [Aromatoleum sp.]|uniref:DUF4381 domain-containing protein n=1 Tax=Aromatoleum sp. TaxID=2307007 RepID=UPI002FCA59A6
MTAQTFDGLRDLHLPPEPGLWPPAPGWWLVAAALALVIAVLAHRHARRRPLRIALREADRIALGWRHDADRARLAAELSRLLRRYASWRFPQRRVAGLVGPAWLAFLDEHGGNGEFGGGIGALLDSLPYRRAARSDLDERPHDADYEALMALVRRWLKANAP